MYEKETQIFWQQSDFTHNAVIIILYIYGKMFRLLLD